MKKHLFVAALFAGLLLLGASRPVLAHCDTLEGPVAVAGKEALNKSDITPILKWVKTDGEKEVRESFAKALKVRALGAEAKELADKYFLETLIRVHRAGEGEPYTGLKSADDVPAGIKLADAAVASGDISTLVKKVTAEIAAELQTRYAALAEKKRHADASVEEGRAYVAAYVSFIHYVEALAAKPASHEAHTPAPAAEHHH